MLAERQPLRFASSRPGAPPHVVPVWHVHEPDDDAICFETDRDSVKVRYVEETGYAAGVADAGNSYSTLRGVLVRGEAEVIEDEADDSVPDRFDVRLGRPDGSVVISAFESNLIEYGTSRALVCSIRDVTESRKLAPGLFSNTLEKECVMLDACHHR